MTSKLKENNNNNESYLSSVGDSQDSASNVQVCVAAASSPNNSGANSARKSLGPPEDRKGTKQSMLIESAIAPTLDHEVTGAYQLQPHFPAQVRAENEAELANSQTGSEGKLTLSLPV